MSRVLIAERCKSDYLSGSTVSVHAEYGYIEILRDWIHGTVQEVLVKSAVKVSFAIEQTYVDTTCFLRFVQLFLWLSRRKEHRATRLSPSQDPHAPGAGTQCCEVNNRCYEFQRIYICVME